MPEKLFPERKRCKKCSKGLGLSQSDPVLFGLYCSPSCAGIATPAKTPADAPRECRTERDGIWVWKRAFRSSQEIPDRLHQDGMSSYFCSHCGHLHVGRSMVDLKRAENRALRDRESIADMLTKARGHATLKQVGEVLKVRPIRIKEWEDPTFDTPSVSVLFALANLYRMDLVAVLKQRR